MNLIKKFTRWFAIPGRLVLDAESRRFVAHNSSLGIGNSGGSDSTRQSVVLLEMNEMHSAVIAYSYLANILAEKHQARLVAFSNSRMAGWKPRLRSLLKFNTRKLYRSFNVSEFFDLSLSPQQERDAIKLFDNLYPRLKSKSDVEKLCVDGVLMGDLVYDTFLRRESVPTVELGDERFIASFRRSLERFVFWQGYFDSHEVKAVNISHCVYDLALPLRIAISRDIPAYQVNATHAYRLNRDNFHAYTDFKYYPQYFERLPIEVQQAGLTEAENRLDRRFSGEVGVDMRYSSKSAFTAINETTVLRESGKVKILIATHCFFDSPHPYGFNLFPDFHEWLNFLGKISKQTDYDWYLKTHPDFLPGNKELIDALLVKYPRFTQIASDTSHKQIIEEGIDFALTVYGTIGFEYAALGVPVINASMSNPHVAYNFNIHPQTVAEYEQILLNLKDQAIKIDKQKVHEYYFMKHIYNTNDWLFDNYRQMVGDLGGYREQFNSRVYDYWVSRWTPERHAVILETLESFVESGDFRLGNAHLGNDCELDAGDER